VRSLKRKIASSGWGPEAAGLMVRVLGQFGVGELARWNVMV
jgi:hypothetical protein